MILLFVLLVVLAGAFFLFKDTMNRLQYVGPVYWITRDTGVCSDPYLAIGFMRQTAAPWKTGKGIQVRVSKYVFQIGICKKLDTKVSEEDGLLHALDGRFLDADPSTIRNWK